MQFGVKVSEDTSTNSNGGGGNTDWIRYFAKGDTVVRFLEEPGDWTKYYQHFNQDKKRGYPCTGNKNSCPGCTSKNERERSASCRFLTNLYLPETEEQYVNLYQIPVSIMDDFERYLDRNGTLMDRDFTIIKFDGSDGKTKYSIEALPKSEVDLTEKKTKMKDHQKALNDAYEEVWGTPGEENQDPEPTSQEAPKEKTDAEKLAEAQARIAEMEAKQKKEEIPSEPVVEEAKAAPQQAPEETSNVQVETENDADAEFTEDDLRNMSADDVRKLFEYTEFLPPKTDSVDELVDALIEATNS